MVARNKKYIEDQPVCENDSTIIYSLLSCIISQALCEMRSFTHNQEFLREVARHKWEEGYRRQQDIGHEGFDDRCESCCNSVNRGESVPKKKKSGEGPNDVHETHSDLQHVIPQREVQKPSPCASYFAVDSCVGV